jgi:hypothetical protein
MQKATPRRKASKQNSSAAPRLGDKRTSSAESAELPLSDMPTAEHPDRGLRLKCADCGGYMMPGAEGRDKLGCDACRDSFLLCANCAPDSSQFSKGSVWLCPSCRHG